MSECPQVLLDVGMATELSGFDRHNLLHLFKSFVEFDGKRMAQCTLDFAGKGQHCPDHEAFKEAIAQCAFRRLHYMGLICLVVSGRHLLPMPQAPQRGHSKHCF